jgi:hypothetical protein
VLVTAATIVKEAMPTQAFVCPGFAWQALAKPVLKQAALRAAQKVHGAGDLKARIQVSAGLTVTVTHVLAPVMTTGPVCPTPTQTVTELAQIIAEALAQEALRVVRAARKTQPVIAQLARYALRVPVRTLNATTPF